jgi:hypothetical protein
MYSGPQFYQTEASAHLQMVAPSSHPKQNTPNTCNAGKHSHSTCITSICTCSTLTLYPAKARGPHVV